jgi:hypothetical protein
MSTSQHSYFLNNPNNKFDINNIVLPNDVLNNCRIVPHVISNVPTPRWRCINNEDEKNKETMTADIEEVDDDQVYLRRHELAELEERYSLFCKLDKKNRKNKQKRKLSSSSCSVEDNNGSPSPSSSSSSSKSAESPPSSSSIDDDDVIVVNNNKRSIQDLSFEEFKNLVLQLENEYHNKVNHNSKRDLTDETTHKDEVVDSLDCKFISKGILFNYSIISSFFFKYSIKFLFK